MHRKHREGLPAHKVFVPKDLTGNGLSRFGSGTFTFLCDKSFCQPCVMVLFHQSSPHSHMVLSSDLFLLCYVSIIFLYLHQMGQIPKEEVFIIEGPNVFGSLESGYGAGSWICQDFGKVCDQEQNGLVTCKLLLFTESVVYMDSKTIPKTEKIASAKNSSFFTWISFF